MSTEIETAPPPPSTEIYEIREMRGKKVSVIIRPFADKYEARKVFPYRPVDPGRRESHWGMGRGFPTDDSTLLREGTGAPCCMCHAATRKYFLNDNGSCPDCDGRAEANGKNPYIAEPAAR